MADEVTIVVRAEDHFSTVLGNFGNIITGIKSLVDLAGDAFRTFTGFVMQGLDAVGTYEKLTLALTTMNAAQMVQAGVAADVNAAWEVSSVKAEELANWMQQLAIHSPFTLEGVANAFRLGMAYGFTAEETQRLTQATIDYAAATGSSEYQMERIVRALGQISATGKLTGQDMLQLTQAGLPVAQILADAFGVSTAEIIKMRTDGLLPAQEVIEAITVWIETNFQGAADRFATSWAGLRSTFQDISQMGLREFFGGLADAIQPAAIALAQFLQTEGIEILRDWGASIGQFLEPLRLLFEQVNQYQETEGISFLTALGMALKGMEGVSSVINDVGQALIVFQGALNTGAEPFAAFIMLLQDLGTIFEGTPLGSIIDTITEFIATADAAGLKQAFINLFQTALGADTFGGVIQNVVDRLALIIAGAEWGPVGATISRVISGSVLTVLEGLHILINQVDWGPFGQALGQAFGEIWQGLATEETGIMLDNLANDMAQGLTDAFTGYVADFFRAEDIARAWTHIWDDVAAGLTSPLTLENMRFNVKNFIDNVIAYFKEILGISSPSTVFAAIGMNIVLGLIQGLLNMIAPLMAILNVILAPILSLLEPVLDILGLGNTGTGGSTAEFGGFDNTTPLTSGSNITNNFYAPVYFQGLQQLGYDCPSPHPLLEASGSSLLTSVTIG